MAQRPQAWERVFDRIRVLRDPATINVLPATDAELEEVEAQVGSRLPHSYREFLKRFGPGEIMGPVLVKVEEARRTAGELSQPKAEKKLWAWEPGGRPAGAAPRGTSQRTRGKGDGGVTEAARPSANLPGGEV